jgi:DnaA-homolog protein
VIGTQLTLSVQLGDTASFDSFQAGPNAATVAALRQLAEDGGETSILLHGAIGSGKTHLLQAVARATTQQRRRAAYLPLAQFTREDAAALQGFEMLDVLCLDDIDSALLDRRWALILLRLIDAIHAHGGRCVLSASAPPDSLPLAPLPDLRTRLAACAVFGLKPLSDADLRALLRRRAHLRGLDLPEEVAEFLLRRLPRSVTALLAALDLLDQDSLTTQRRLTIPFAQQVLGALSPPGVQKAPG